MMILLVLSALLVAVASTMFVSEATLGVWFMAGAILIVALARIAQAAAQHNEMRALVRKDTSSIPVAEITSIDHASIQS